MIDPPDLSPGSSPWDTNRTNRTRSSGGKYESAIFLTPAEFLDKQLKFNYNFRSKNVFLQKICIFIKLY